MKDKIKFSIIIPTRERHVTLIDTIRTCLNQDYENFEIIVSDNFSTIETKNVTEIFNDPRIVYINTGKRISMSHNWEFALNYVTGDFVTYLGDDDGLLPGALERIANILQSYKVDAIVWKWASYFWPNAISEDSRNKLFVPTAKEFEIRNATQQLENVIQFKSSYEELPFLYKGFVSINAINKVKQLSGGQFFHSMIPDVYSAISLSCVIKEYYFSKEPFSINGTSGASNGASSFHKDKSANAAEQFESEKNIPFHSKAEFCPSVPMIVAECFYQAQEVIPFLKDLNIDNKQLIDKVINDSLSGSTWRYTETLKSIIKFGEKHNILDYVKNRINTTDYVDYTHLPAIGLTPGYNIKNKVYIIDCANLHVKNIYDAAFLCGFIMNSKYTGQSTSIKQAALTTAKLIKGGLLRYLMKKKIYKPKN